MVWTVETSDGAEEARNGRRWRRHPSIWFSLPVLFAFLRFPSSPPEGWDEEEDEPGRMSERRGDALLLVVGRSAARCGDVVAMTSPRSGRGGRPSLTLGDVASGRGGDRLAIVWTVKTSDGAEEARNGRRWRLHPSPWFSLFLPFCLLFCSSPALLPLFFLYI